MKALLRAAERFFEDDGRPAYDPVHVAAVLVVTLAAFGALYWILWTLLIFEGGLPTKAAAAWAAATGQKTLAQLGYEGPHARGAFEGWLGNVGALAAAAAAAALLAKTYREGEARWRRKD